MSQFKQRIQPWFLRVKDRVRFLRALASAWGAVCVLLVFLSLALLGGSFLSHVSFDFSAGKVYTLPKEAVAYLKTQPRTLDAYFYYSKEKIQRTSLSAYAQQVEQTLLEIERASGGRFRLHYLDPQPFSAEEENARLRGISKIPSPDGSSLFFGISIINELDERRAIGFFNPERQRFLVYDLLSMIHVSSRPREPVLGVYDTLPLGDKYNPYADSSSPFKPQEVIKTLQQLYQVVPLPVDRPLNAETLRGLDALLLIQPDDRFSLDDAKLLEGFLRSGRHVTLMLDPKSEYFPSEHPSKPLTLLLAHYGVYLPMDVVVASVKGAEEVRSSQQVGTHLGVFETSELNPESPVSAGLSLLSFASASFIRTTEASPALKLTPLVYAPQGAGAVSLPNYNKLFYPKDNLARPMPRPNKDAEKPLLAAILEGESEGYFSSEGATPVSLTLVSDTSWLSDIYWKSDEGSKSRYDNLGFFLNLMDHMTGVSQLLSLRGGQSASRPFVLVEKLSEKADAHLRLEARALDLESRKLNEEYMDLKATDLRTQGQGLSPADRAHMAELSDRINTLQLQIREKSGFVYKEVEELFAKIRFFSILFVPVLVAILGLSVLFFRQKRRRMARSSFKGRS